MCLSGEWIAACTATIVEHGKTGLQMSVLSALFKSSTAAE